MQTENNYDRHVFNGDLGFVAAIDQGEFELTIDVDSRPVTYPFGELDEVTPASPLRSTNRKAQNIRPSWCRS